MAPTTTSQEQQQHQHQHQQQEERDSENDGVVMDTLAGLTEPERLALLIRFGAKGGMCAAMSHGHSFQSSIFRLPAKCAGCHELVWGPFTRGCTCLTCSVTVHRSCTGMATLPRCPTKGVFNAFCRAELGLAPPPAPAPAAPAAAAGSRTPAGGGKDGDKAPGGAPPAGSEVGGAAGDGSAAVTGGDLEEWAKVDGVGGHSNSTAAATARSPRQQQQQQQQEQEPPASASCAVQDLGSSFSWSPLVFGGRKRPIAEDASEGGRELAVICKGADEDVASSSSPEAADKEEAGRAAPTAASVATTSAAADGAASSTPNNNNNNNNMGIRGVTRMSVAGGVVGALFGGPVGAVVGLKVGAVLGAGRSVQQGLWQRIEKNRREAGAVGIALPAGPDGEEAAVAAAGMAADKEAAAAARKPRDVWARIAQQVEGERQPAIWYVSFHRSGLGVELNSRLIVVEQAIEDAVPLAFLSLPLLTRPCAERVITPILRGSFCADDILCGNKAVSLHSQVLRIEESSPP